MPTPLREIRLSMPRRRSCTSGSTASKSSHRDKRRRASRSIFSRPEEKTQAYTPMPMMKPLSPCRSPRCPNRGPGYSPTCQGLVANRLLGPIHGRGVWLFGKWRDVVDQVRAFSAHGPDVPALGTAVVVSARQFARERQKPARRTVTRWTVRDRGHAGGAHIIHRRWQFAQSGSPRTAMSVSTVSGRRRLRY